MEINFLKFFIINMLLSSSSPLHFSLLFILVSLFKIYFSNLTNFNIRCSLIFLLLLINGLLDLLHLLEKLACIYCIKNLSCYFLSMLYDIVPFFSSLSVLHQRDIIAVINRITSTELSFSFHLYLFLYLWFILDLLLFNFNSSFEILFIIF